MLSENQNDEAHLPLLFLKIFNYSIFRIHEVRPTLTEQEIQES
jgi:hypothetical protein